MRVMGCGFDFSNEDGGGVRRYGESLNFAISGPNELAPPYTTINRALGQRGIMLYLIAMVGLGHSRGGVGAAIMVHLSYTC